SNNKVPLLGQLPGVGHLFKVDQDTRSKTELFIVVTPHIVQRGDPVPGPVMREQARPQHP
ncbi:MAG TPA: hypothetical protein VFE13_10535, partial [Caulobacteraceae bacterium]|nr:hypothetical protein [Caulobacteraceae bacterium]